MTDLDTALPAALSRALELIADPPEEPDVADGYLDLLGSQQTADVPKNTGPIQAAWASPLGSMIYDNTQALSRRVFARVWRHPIEWLSIPQGGTALDVGCGPGNITASLASAAGPGGLALGVDISRPMLRRAVRAQAGPNTGFILADAQWLPLRDETVDAVVSIAALQLVPSPETALAEIGRVLRPGGRLALAVPTAGPGARFWQLLPSVGARMFGLDEIGDYLEDHGFVSVRTSNVGTFQWVRGKRA